MDRLSLYSPATQTSWVPLTDRDQFASQVGRRSRHVNKQAHSSFFLGQVLPLYWVGLKLWWSSALPSPACWDSRHELPYNISALLARNLSISANCTIKKCRHWTVRRLTPFSKAAWIPRDPGQVPPYCSHWTQYTKAAQKTHLPKWLRTEDWDAEGLRSQEAVVAGGLVLFCWALDVAANGLKLGAFNLSKIWELEIFTILEGASSPNPEPRTDDCEDRKRASPEHSFFHLRLASTVVWNPASRIIWTGQPCSGGQEMKMQLCLQNQQNKAACLPASDGRFRKQNVYYNLEKNGFIY